jgi:hypothetical protein
MSQSGGIACIVYLYMHLKYYTTVKSFVLEAAQGQEDARAEA